MEDVVLRKEVMMTVDKALAFVLTILCAGEQGLELL